MYPSTYSLEQFIIYFIESILETHDLKDKDMEKFEKRNLSAQQPVLDYLLQVDDRGEMELRLYAIFGFVFNVETTYFLMRTALKKSKQYLEIPAAKSVLHSILSNNFSTFLFNNRLDYAAETIELFEKKYSEDTETIAPHIDFMFNKGLLAFKKTSQKRGRCIVKKLFPFVNYSNKKQVKKAIANVIIVGKKNMQTQNLKN